jgi:hypothetical protein
MLENARAAQALAPRVSVLLFIKSTEYLVNPVSSIQLSGRLLVQRFCPNNMAQF